MNLKSTNLPPAKQKSEESVKFGNVIINNTPIDQDKTTNEYMKDVEKLKKAINNLVFNNPNNE